MNFAPQSAAGPSGPARRPFWSLIFSTDHRIIGVEYLLLSLVAVTVGVLLSLAMRFHLAWPDLPIPFWGRLLPEDYLRLVTLHGTLMVFFVLTVAPQSGFANLILPAQVGARRMALPWLNAIAFWITAAALVTLLAGFFSSGGSPISGWTAYPPLSAVPAAGPGQGAGMDFWLASLALFCIGSWMSAVNVLATVAGERCAGMTFSRLPLTVWAWMVTAMLILLAFGVLFAAILLLSCDRHFGTSFFLPMGDRIAGIVLRRGNGSPLLWLHLFWFFGHPEVYISILPGMGIVSSLLPNFSRRPARSYRTIVAATVLIGLLGFVVWGHHMFVSGMNPYAGTAFSMTTIAIAVPSAAEVFCWLGTLWGGGLRLKVPMLFALGFVSLFIAGGLTGPILAQPTLDTYLHNTYFVVAHFHLIMGMASVFSIFAGVYYWFPLWSGRRMNERLGQWHFWLTFLGAYATFLPMHFAGLAGAPRHYERLNAGSFPSGLEGLLPLERGISIAAFLLGAAQLLFLFNLAWSLWRGPRSEQNPWRATTLEWVFASPAAVPIDPPPTVSRGPYEYGGRWEGQGEGADFRMQWEPGAKQE